jgi:hypothetical protein
MVVCFVAVFRSRRGNRLGETPRQMIRSQMDQSFVFGSGAVSRALPG